MMAIAIESNNEYHGKTMQNSSGNHVMRRFPKMWVPQIIHFTRIFHLQTIHFGIPAFLGTPHIMAAKSTISEPGKPQHPVVVNDAPAESLSHTVDLTKL